MAFPVIGWTDPPLPSGGTVVSGTVGIATPGPQNMVITQGSDRAVVNWNSFSVGQGAAVDIRQPGSNSAILNRVTGDTTSNIYGRLTANGQVHIVNPNGIFIGRSGRIETGGGFVASTLNISDEDFRAGRLRYQGQGTSAGVTNQGVISVGQGGYAALIGGRVNNAGIISAPMGRIGLGAGERATLDLSGDGFLQVALPSGEDGDDSALVTNSGTLSAEGGRIEMRAATARNAARQAINLSGVAEARSVAVRNGVIVLGGGDGGTVRVTGRASTRSAAPRVALNSSDRPPQPTGGRIDITGAQIALAGAVLDASGEGGGGRIRVGGDFGGNGTMPRAQTLSVDAATRIRADALTRGDGGRIVLWSERNTGFAGQMSARGGSEGGNGGFAEVSSRRDLRYDGLTDLRAPRGDWGRLLLDPENITIPGTMSEAAVEAQLAVGNLTLDTSNCTGSDCVDIGDITIRANIEWTAATTFTLAADNNVYIYNPIVPDGGPEIGGSVNAPNGTLEIRAQNEVTLGEFLGPTVSVPPVNILVRNLIIDAGVTPGGAAVTDRIYLDNANVVETGSGGRVRAYGFAIGGSSWIQRGPALSPFNVTDFLLASGTFMRVAGGAGTQAAPYVLTDVYGLQGMSSPDLLDSDFVLGNDIDATGTARWSDFDGLDIDDGAILGFIPIGDGVGFTGSLDGNGHSIDGLYVDWSNAGLFGQTNGAEIRDLNLTGLSVTGTPTDFGTGTGTGAVGGVVGRATDTVLDNVSVAGSVMTHGTQSSRSTGGLVGEMTGGSITDSRFAGTVQDDVAADSVFGGYQAFIGGIVGRGEGDLIITGTTSSGALRALGSGATAAGGIAGLLSGIYGEGESLIPSISNSTSSMNIRGELLSYSNLTAGGLVGESDATISSSSASGNVISATAAGGPVSSSATLGGLIGSNTGSITDSSATGNVRINYDDGGESFELNVAGGFVGTHDGGTIARAFATGNVTVTSTGAAYVGGFVGWNIGAITDAFSRGNVGYTQNSDYLSDDRTAAVGGFAGFNESGEGAVAWMDRTAAHGAVNASSTLVAQDVGGHTGRSYNSDIINSYANGDVTASSDFMQNVGGLIGSTYMGTVTDTYSSGAVRATGAGSNLVGGLIGLNETFDGSGTPPSTDVEGSFWDLGRSGQAAGTLPGYGTGISTALFRNTAAFLAFAQVRGWDFANIWAPGDANADPALYTIDRVVFARPNAVSVQYGLTGTATTTGTVTGGTGRYVFAPEGDTLNTAPVFQRLTFPSRNVGTGQFTLTTAALTSRAGESYRVVDLPAAYAITPASLTITANDRTKTYGQGIGFDGTEFTTSRLYFDDSVDQVVLTSGGARADANVAGGPYAINGRGASGDGLSNYTITYVAGDMTVNRAALTITANDATKTYGQGVSFDGTEFTTQGLLFDDGVGRVNLTSAGARADANVAGGPYAINASGASGDGLSNYTVTYVAGDMTVNRAALTITANDATKTYGQGVGFDGTEFTTRGLLFDDGVGRVSLTSDGAAAGANVGSGSYTINAADASGEGLSNYAITYVDGDMTVNRAALTITADDQSKIFGQEVSFDGTEFSTRGLVLSDRVDSVNLASLGAGSDASFDGSPYAITADDATGSGLDNYAITYQAGALSVLPGADNTPRPGVIFPIPGPGLPNPVDDETGWPFGPSKPISDPGGTISDPRGTIAPPIVVVDDTDGSDTGSDAGGTTVTDSTSQAVQTLEAVDDMSTVLEIAARSCAQSDGDVTRYLACLSDALSKFASDLDAISTDLPPGMENVAQIVRDARTRVDAARIRAEQRLAGASTDAERAAIRRDAINEARGAVATASAEIRKAITLVRADDPELARVQAATGARIVRAVDSVNIELSRAVGL